MDGRVNVERCLISFFNKETGDGYRPELMIRIEGETLVARMQTLADFLEEYGLECKGELSYLSESIRRAYTELEQLIRYQEWNNSPIFKNETLEQGYQNGLALNQSYMDAYLAVKDRPAVGRYDYDMLSSLIRFSELTDVSVAASSFSVTDGIASVSVTDLSLTIDDTLLMVDGGAYRIAFALIPADGSALIHLGLPNVTPVVYQRAETFTVTQSQTFSLPLMPAGSYSIVAYIATYEQEIRSSAYQKLTVKELTVSEFEKDNVSVTAALQSDGSLVLTYVSDIDVETTLNRTGAEALSAAEMTDYLSQLAYQYGFAAEGAQVEMLTEGDVWTAIKGDEEALTDGTYRLKYDLVNGSFTLEGYVSVVYKAKRAIFSPLLN